MLAAVAMHSVSYADVTTLPLAQREKLKDSNRFRQIHSVVDLPAKVVALCADENGRIADPGQNWEPSDYITNPDLPRKRLIWAATDGAYYIVHYERGGYAHSFHVLVANVSSSKSKVEVVWRGVGPELKDLPAFRAALVANTLDDRREYAH